jgi:hypothetical protein
VKARLSILMFLLGVLSADAAEQSPRLVDRAVLMRLTRDSILDAPDPGVSLYLRFFEAFPQSFSDMGQLLASDAYIEKLKRSDEDWDYGNGYLRTMCEASTYMDHHAYMMKLLMMGVEANKWGETEKLHHPGDNYQRLVWGTACEELTESSSRIKVRTIIDLLPQFNDNEVEAIYNSLSWDGFTRFPLDWFWLELCERYSARCALGAELKNNWSEYLKSRDTERREQ